MTTIKLQTNDLVLTATVKPPVASGSRNAVELVVTFDSNWSAYTKSAIFYTSKNSTPYEVVLTGGTTCRIPQEVLREECILYIGVKGVSGAGSIKSSALVKYRIVPGAPIVVVSDPSDNVYTQLLNGYNAIANRFYNLSTLEVNTPLKLTFSSRITALVTVNGPGSQAYATYLIQGYGVSSERLHVTTLHAGNHINFEISSTEEAVTITAGGANSVSVGIFMLYGNMPAISY